MDGFVILFVFLPLGCFCRQKTRSSQRNLVNFTGLNKVLRSEVLMSEDRQLRAVHLILDFELLSDKFQDVGHIIRARDPRLAQIDFSMPGFLAQEDLPLVELPLHQSPYKVSAPKEEKASSRLSLKT